MTRKFEKRFKKIQKKKKKKFVLTVCAIDATVDEDFFSVGAELTGATAAAKDEEEAIVADFTNTGFCAMMLTRRAAF